MPNPTLPESDRTIITHQSMILKDLQRLIGPAAVIGDNCGRAVFDADAYEDCRCTPLAVVLPTSTDEVSRVLAYASENHIKIIARGGGTGTTGAATPTKDAIVVCLSRMNSVLAIDTSNRTVQAQAGITTQALSRSAAEHGFFFAPDPESAPACTLGGNIATDASGSHGLKYGTTANHLLGVTLVMMDGEIIQIGGSHLDGAGFDLLGLLCGSEGQLGIITEATVRILRKTEICRPVLLGFASVQAAGQCVAAILKAGFVPTAIEFMDRAAIEACKTYTGAGYPANAEALIIVEMEGSMGEISSLLSKIVETAKTYGPNVVRVAHNDEQSAAIWKGRKSVFGAIAAQTETRCLDGAIPLGRLAEVMQTIGEICARHGLSAVNIYHAGDGTLHPILFHKANKADGDSAQGHEVQGHEVQEREVLQREVLGLAGEQILQLCVDVGGALSGENGIGLEKRDLMRVQFSDEDLALQMRIKTAFDPGWLLNSAKMFPLTGRGAVARSS